MPPLCKDDIIHTNYKDKANILYQFFTEQSTLYDSNVSLPSINHAFPYKLDSISITSFEVEDILKTLKTGKAAGPDSIDNRLLSVDQHVLILKKVQSNLFKGVNQGKPQNWLLKTGNPLYSFNYMVFFVQGTRKSG